MKTLDGLFFHQDEDLYLISGTEIGEGSFSQVFVYNVEQDEMVISRSLEGSRSMTAFCEAGSEIYFATISGSTSQGCDLYSWDKTANEIRNCAHLDSEKGIYALAWDGMGRLFVATSYPAGLYSYCISSGELLEVCTGFTEEPYVRSLSYVDGVCYLGIGSKAALIAVDALSGEYRSILPETWSGEAFVYEQTVYHGRIYLLLSPSYTILEFDPQATSFTDTGMRYRENYVPPPETLSTVNVFASESALDLLGDLLLTDGSTVTGVLSPGANASWLDMDTGTVHSLTISGIYQQTDMAENVLFQRDLGSLLEKSYVIPTEFLAYDDILYVPDRRFVVRDIANGSENTFLLTDEPQASTVTKDGIYTANYTACTLYYYPFDTFRQSPSSVFMNDPEQFLLADIEEQCRPSQMEVTPDGRYLVVGSGPLYGQFGGAVSVYDLEAGKLLYTHTNVVPNHTIQSVECSASNPGTVWLGTNPCGENTSPACLDEPSHLVLWDIEAEQILLDIIPDGQMKKLPSITEQEGRVYCVTQAAHLLSFDADSGEALAANREAGIVEVLSTSRGSLLGISTTAVYSIDPGTLRTKEFAGGFTLLSHLTEDPVTGTLYVFDDTELIQLVNALS